MRVRAEGENGDDRCKVSVMREERRVKVEGEGERMRGKGKGKGEGRVRGKCVGCRV